jgi:alpha-glucosidase
VRNNDARDWWRHAAIYQVYPRSFADGDGDGVGDLAGIRERLGYLHDLGVNAIWFSPWYPSPMADAGYDVADYRDIDPSFGTLADAEQLIAEAHAFGIRTIIDIVPNHCSDAHPWFQRALASPPGSPARDPFWFRAGRGERGELPPNDWQSIFGGPAWTRAADGRSGPQGEAAGARPVAGDWYLHLFAPEQPDFNWDHPAVRAEFADILRFWFARGVDGIRIDSAALCAKDPSLPSFAPADPPDPHPYIDRDDVHEIYRQWRGIAESYETPRALIGEVWLADTDRFAQYLRSDEMHAGFNFDFLGCPWDAKALRSCIEQTLASHAPVGAPSSWVLANHDVTRTVTRYGRAETGFEHGLRQARHRAPTDPVLGLRRARAAALLTLALPGAVYIYQGESRPDLPPDRARRPGARRLPRTVAVVGHGSVVRVQCSRCAGAVAAATCRLVHHLGRAPARRRGLRAFAVPPGTGPACGRDRPRRRPDDLAGLGRRRARLCASRRLHVCRQPFQPAR